MFRSFAAISCGALLQLCLSFAPASAETGRLPSGVSPVAYDIMVTPDAGKLSFAGEEAITIDVAAPTRTITLNAADLLISSAVLDGTVPAKVTTDEASQTVPDRHPHYHSNRIYYTINSLS